MGKKLKDPTNLPDEKLYTSQDIESIVEARLKRERRNSDFYTKMHEAIASIRKEETFSNLSNAALAKKLSEIAQNVSSDKTPAEEKVPVAVPDAQENPESGMAEQNSGGKEKRVEEISEFIASYGEEKLVALMEDKAFRSFCKRHDGDLLTLYEDYTIFLSQLANANSAVNARAAQRGLASTGFSGYAAGTPDYASLLTENQKKIATAAGMSYRQYSELMAQIPAKKIGK